MKNQSLKSDTIRAFRALRGAGVLLPAILLALALWSPVGAAEGSVVPEGLCERLSDLTDVNELRDVLRAAPQFFKKGGDGVYRPVLPIKSVPRMVAVELLDAAAAQNRGGVEFVADAHFRDSCAYYVRSETVRVLDGLFILNLATPLSGVDTHNRQFRMKAMVLGGSQVSFVYENGEVRYRNRDAGRDFKLGQSVGFQVAVDGEGAGKTIYLNDAKNIEVQTGFPFGWEKVERIRQKDHRLDSWVLGKWRTGRKVEAIRRKQVAAASFHADGFGRSGVWRGSASLGQLQALSGVPAFAR